MFPSLQALHIHQRNNRICRQAAQARLAVIQSNEPDYTQERTHNLDMDVDSPEQDSPNVDGVRPDLWEEITMDDININMEDPDTQGPADWNGAESESSCEQ